jgi:exopolysaccharide transport family protein
LLIDTRSSNVVDVDAVLSGIGENDKQFQSQLEIIRSTTVARRVMKQLDLKNNPEFQPKESLLSSLWTKVFPASKEEAIKPQPTERDLLEDAIINTLKANLSVSVRRRSLVVNVSYTALSPKNAAKIANAFAEAYRVDHLETKYDATKRANDWLNQRLSILRDRVRASEQAVEVYRAENNLHEAEGTTINEKQISELNQQLILARAKTAESSAKVSQIAKVRKEGGSAASFADAQQSQIITQLRSKASEIGRELAQLTAKYGRKHPEVISVRSQLADIRRQINSAVELIVNTARNELEVSKSREQSIIDSLDKLKSNSFSENQAAVYLRELEREAETNRTLYQSFLTRFKETQAAESLDTTETRILTAAQAPRGASFPKKSLFLTLGLIFGFLLGGLIAIVLEILDFSISDPADVKDRLGQNLFATLPTITLDGEVRKTRKSVANLLRQLYTAYFKPTQSIEDSSVKSRIRDLQAEIASYSANHPLSAYAEGIRSLRSHLRYFDIDNPLKVIMLSSSIPGEGKSTTAVNLAKYAAKTGERVLLIDSDFRHPVLTKALYPEVEKSLLDVLTNHASVSEVIRQDPETGLFFLPAPIQDDLWQTAEILSSDAMRTFIDGARKSFDLVVIDSSPILPVMDGKALSSLTDGVVIVVEHAATNKNAIKEAIAQIANANGHTLGVVLNNVDTTKKQGYGYGKYGYGGYGHAYGTYGVYGQASAEN